MSSILKVFSSALNSGASESTPATERGRDRKITQILSPALPVVSRAHQYKPGQVTRLTESEKEELLQHSLLNVAQGEFPGGTALLAQIHADALIGNTPLEGLPSPIGAQAWAHFMKQVREVEVPEEVQRSLEQYAETTRELDALSEGQMISQSKRLTQRIQALPAQGSFLLEGGFQKTPLVFEFVRVNDTHYDLFVYSPGIQGAFRGHVQEVGRKFWNRPIVQYENIPATVLFFDKQSHLLVQAILEARFGSQAVTAGYVHLGLLAHLQPYRNEHPVAISDRRAFTDAWSSLKPFVLRKMGKEGCRRALLEIKLHSLIEGYQKVRSAIAHDTPEFGQWRIVLKRGAQLLLKNLASLHNTGIALSDSLYQHARATAVDLIDTLERIERTITQERKAHIVPFNPPQNEENRWRKTYQDALRNAQAQVVEARALPGQSINSTRARLIDLPGPQAFPSMITAFVGAYQGEVSIPFIQTAEIEHLVVQMPIPLNDSPYWDNLPPSELLEALGGLHQLLCVYTIALANKKAGLSAKEANTVYALYAIIHHVALAQDRIVQKGKGPEDPATLSHYPIGFPGLSADKDPFLSFTSPEDYARHRTILGYFQKHQQRRTEHYSSTALFPVHQSYSFTYDSGSPRKSTSNAEPLMNYLLHLAGDGRFADLLTKEILKNASRDFDTKSFIVISSEVKKGALASELLKSLTPPIHNKEDNSNPYGRDYQDPPPPTYLADKGFGHLPLLAQAARIAYAFGDQEIPQKIPHSLHSMWGPRYHDKVFHHPRGYEWSLNYYAYSDGSRNLSAPLHPSLRDRQKNILRNPWISPNKNADTQTQEGEVLKLDGPSESTVTDTIAFLRGACEPSLFPYKLLAYFRSRLDLFETFSEQTLFELALYRVFALKPPSKRSHYEAYVPEPPEAPFYYARLFPLADEMHQEGFQHQAVSFLQEGIDRYFLRQPNQKPKVLPVSLFLRMASRLSRFGERRPLLDTIALIDKMLAVPSITDEERSLLSLHFVHAYSTLNRPLSREEVEKVFGAWVYYKNTPTPDWRNPLLEREAETLIHAISASLSPDERDQSFHRAILITALQQLGIRLPHTIATSAAEPHLITAKHGPAFWTVNILTGEVLANDGILRRTRSPRELPPAFSTLFGASFAPSYFETSSCYYFSHPRLGSFRIIKSNSRSLQSLIEGEWYQYVYPDPTLTSIPRFLCAEHTHWIPADGHRAFLRIHQRRTGALVAQINNQGTIASITENEIYWNLNSNSPFKTFERPEYIHWSKLPRREPVIHFWRFQSFSHHPLSFEFENRALVYTANRRYQLSSEQKPGLLGTTNGSLVLVHRETGAEKVLVALQPIIQLTPFSTQHSLSVEGVAGEGYYASQKGAFYFLEFDVSKEGNLVPLNLEGSWFLSYHALTQRKYEEAFRLLKKIDFRDPLTQTSKYFVQNMIQIASTTDISPEATAIALHAWVLHKKAAHRKARENGRVAESLQLNNLTATYGRFEHHIPEPFLLNAADRALCNLPDRETKIARAFPSLQKYLPAHRRMPVTISLPDLPPEERAIVEQVLRAGKNAPKPPALPPPAPPLSDAKWKKMVEHIIDTLLNLTAFIPEKPVASTFEAEHLLIQVWTPEFEKGFFSTAYEILRRKQGSTSDFDRLHFQMQVLSEHFNSDQFPPCWPFLLVALHRPQAAPDLPVPGDLYARYQFLIRCHELANEIKIEEDTSPFEKEIGPPKNPPSRPLQAPLIPAREVQDRQIPLHLAPFSKAVIDDGFTHRVFAAHFQPQPHPLSDSTVPLPLSQVVLSKEEEDFDRVLKTELAEFAEDYKEGVQINANRVLYDLKDPPKLKEKLETEITDLNTQIIDVEAAILELANKHDPEERKRTLYKEARIEQELSLKRLADLFLQADAQAFAIANPYLRNRDLIRGIAQAYNLAEYDNLVIDYLYQQIGVYMTLCTQRDRLQRALKNYRDLIPLRQDDLARDALVQKLAEELQPLQTPIYSLDEHPAFLVFEYLSGLSIRRQQAALLMKFLECDSNGKYINRVIQLIMGGGKTSVMAVILLKLAAKKGRLSLFVTLASQHASVSYNLRKTLRDCFGIDMEEIEATRQQLSSSPTMCQEILDRLQNTVRAGDFLLVKSETLQTLGLQFVDFLYRVAHLKQAPSPELMGKINALKDVLILLKLQGDALLDEVDLLLYVLFVLNFPVGEMEKVSTERIEVIRALFNLFQGENVALSDDQRINLKEIIGLQLNRQNLVSRTIWTTQVAKAVAYNLLRTLDSLKLQGRPDFTPSFEGYIAGTLSYELQRLLDNPDQRKIDRLTRDERRDFEFLQHVKRLRFSQDPAEQEAAHHIALIKHMMQTVLNVTFEKTGKRNYGRGGAKPGEVRPYLAVDTPSENLFGYHWEAIAYHFQTALQCGISREQLLEIAKVYKAQAEIYAEREKLVFDQTPEAIEFKDLTGVALHELEDPRKVDEANQNLNKNTDALLRFEADTAAEYVGYYPLRLTSTGQILVDLLSTVRAMSGTTWNTPCYPSSLSTNYEPAVGTEGQIAHAVLSRVAHRPEGKKYVHLIDSSDIKTLLPALLDKHPQKERVRLLLDAGALFKNYSNLEVARAIRDYTGMPVLFFMRNPQKKEKTPDTLAVLKVGAKRPDIIGGTRLEDIERTGLKLTDYFVFNDERHTTGTDIPYLPDVVGLMTCDETMLRRSLYQTILRERDFFLHQDVEFVVPRYLIPILDSTCSKLNSDDDEELRLVIEQTVLGIKNQAITKAKHYDRACKYKIDAIFRKHLFGEFLTEKPLSAEIIQGGFPAYERVTLTQQSDAPYDLFGAIEYPVDFLESVENYARRKLGAFPGDHPRYQEVEREIQAIIEEAKISPYRPDRVMEGASNELGMQCDVLTEVAQEVNQEVDQEVEQEVLQELQAYQFPSHSQIVAERQWSPDEIFTFIGNIRQGERPPRGRFFMLSQLFRDYFPYQHDYSPVFSSDIFVTHSWAFATKEVLPVFHKLQRPLDQILVIATDAGGYEAIALSQNEARQFKEFFRTSPQGEKVWLIQPDGNLLQDTCADPFPIREERIQTLLVECNAFSGRIDYLNAHEDPAEKWLTEYDSAYVEIKKRFLKLRVAQNPVQKRLFFRSEIFGDNAAKIKARQYRWRMVPPEIASLGAREIQAFTEKDIPKLKWLSEKQLNMLTPHQVPWLGGGQIPLLTQPELIQAIPPTKAAFIQLAQLQHAGPDHVASVANSVTRTQALPARLCRVMSDEQMKNLSPRQVGTIESTDQLERLIPLDTRLLAHVSIQQVQNRLVTPAIVPHMRSKEAIEALPEELWQYVPEHLRPQRRAPLSALARPAEQVIEPALEEAAEVAEVVPQEALQGAVQPAAVKKVNAPSERSITKIVLATLGSLVAAGILVTGAFALMGALWTHAPQFTVTIYHAFQSPLFLPGVAAGGGLLFCVGLTAYAIHSCRKPARQRIPPRPAL